MQTKLFQYIYHISYKYNGEYNKYNTKIQFSPWWRRWASSGHIFWTSPHVHRCRWPGVHPCRSLAPVKIVIFNSSPLPPSLLPRTSSMTNLGVWMRREMPCDFILAKTSFACKTLRDLWRDSCRPAPWHVLPNASFIPASVPSNT